MEKAIERCMKMAQGRSYKTVCLVIGCRKTSTERRQVQPHATCRLLMDKLCELLDVEWPPELIQPESYKP